MIFERADDGTCLICGHDIDAHAAAVCPSTCRGCNRLLEQVAEGALDDCPICLRYLESGIGQ